MHLVPGKNSDATTIDAKLIAVDFLGGVQGTREDAKVVKFVPAMELEVAA